MELTKPALTSVRLFFCGCAISIIYLTRISDNYLTKFAADNIIIILAAYPIAFTLILRLKLSPSAYEVAIRSFSLGVVFGFAVLLSLWADTSAVSFGWYLCLLSFFHISEYVATALINPRTLSLDSFLINHSREYNLAAIFSWIEFWIEWFLFPDIKGFHLLSLLGVLMCLVGEVIRKLAMFTARTNFNHVIQVYKEEGHVLVTNGIYNIWRHPAYVGWFWWSVGTQIVLCNPVCLIGYIIASWNFFNERIYEEEIFLLNFFGDDYFKYQKKVPTGLPFISGFRVEL